MRSRARRSRRAVVASSGRSMREKWPHSGRRMNSAPVIASAVRRRGATEKNMSRSLQITTVGTSIVGGGCRRNATGPPCRAQTTAGSSRPRLSKVASVCASAQRSSKRAGVRLGSNPSGSARSFDANRPTELRRPPNLRGLRRGWRFSAMRRPSPERSTRYAMRPASPVMRAAETCLVDCRSAVCAAATHLRAQLQGPSRRFATYRLVDRGEEVVGTGTSRHGALGLAVFPAGMTAAHATLCDAVDDACSL